MQINLYATDDFVLIGVPNGDATGSVLCHDNVVRVSTDTGHASYFTAYSWDPNDSLVLDDEARLYYIACWAAEMDEQSEQAGTESIRLREQAEAAETVSKRQLDLACEAWKIVGE